MVRLSTFLFLLVATIGLAGCKTSDERAEEHFQNALKLIEAGDFARAGVEFRNVFDMNGEHRDARKTFAAMLREQGDLRQSYSQYLRLIEQHHDDVDARLALAEMALTSNDLEETQRHVDAGLTADPSNLRLKAVKAGLSYSQGLKTKTDTLTETGLAEAQALLADLPDNLVLQRVRVDDSVRTESPADALVVIDEAIRTAPQDMGFQRQRLVLLNQLGRTSDITAQLEKMVELFPNDTDMERTLIAWYIDQEAFDEAEGFLRNKSASSTGDDTPQLDLIAFLARYRSAQAALDEVETLIAADPDNVALRGTRARLNFQSGNQDKAIADLRELISSAPDSQQLNDVKVVLATMMESSDNVVGARALIEEVLENDSSNMGALKLKAGWLIDQDKTDAAIIALRSALDQDPRDADVMTLMARAHQRAGNQDLAGEMLALAVDASNNAAEPSVRYANFLIGQDQTQTAINTLSDALRLRPTSIPLLLEIGKIHVSTRDWDSARDIVDRLGRIEDSERAVAAADSLNATIIAGESGIEDSVEFLDDMVKQGRGGVPAQAAIVRSHVQSGNVDAAQTYIDEAVSETPGEPRLRFIQASVQALQGDADIAEQNYRDIVAEVPQFALAWRALYVQLSREGRIDEAQEVLQAGLAAVPEDRDLRWAQAGAFEQAGQPEKALEIYQSLYDEDSTSPIVANNLASLTAELSDDPEELIRALEIARRLRGSSFAPFQDTYGWIAYRTGDYASAEEYLRPAAAQMEDNPLVQYHLGMTLLKVGKPDEAVQYLQKAVDLAGEDDKSAPIEEARQEIAKLAK